MKHTSVKISDHNFTFIYKQVGEPPRDVAMRAAFGVYKTICVALEIPQEASGPQIEIESFDKESVAA